MVSFCCLLVLPEILAGLSPAKSTKVSATVTTSCLAGGTSAADAGSSFLEQPLIQISKAITSKTANFLRIMLLLLPLVCCKTNLPNALSAREISLPLEW